MVAGADGRFDSSAPVGGDADAKPDASDALDASISTAEDSGEAADAESDTGSNSDASFSNLNCIPNPVDNPLCPEICDEICNGKDDDCDSQTDEDVSFLECISRMHAQSYCSMGRCESGECLEGYADCDGDEFNGCEADLSMSKYHCGACNRNCGHFDHVGTAFCFNSDCNITCESGFGNCDGITENGCETRLDTLTDCRACGISCELSSCAGGQCTSLTCESGYADCDGNTESGCETPLNSIADCALCGEICDYPNATTKCESGRCEFIQCKPGFGDCDNDLTNGCETVLNTVFNCSSCNDRCKSVETCAAGVCTEAICKINTGDCDGDLVNGCETPLNTDTNCRYCGVPCTSNNGEPLSCAAGACRITECEQGLYDCDRNPANGCESRLRDNLNCGSCKEACSITNAFASCTIGICEFIGCRPHYKDCDNNLNNGCEVELGSDFNCSACGDACLNGTACIDDRCQQSCDSTGCPSCPFGYTPCCKPDQTCGCFIAIGPIGTTCT